MRLHRACVTCGPFCGFQWGVDKDLDKSLCAAVESNTPRYENLFADAIDDALQGMQQSEEAQVSEDVLDILQTQREQQQRAASANQEVSPSYTRDLLPVFSY